MEQTFTSLLMHSLPTASANKLSARALRALLQLRQAMPAHVVAFTQPHLDEQLASAHDEAGVRVAHARRELAERTRVACVRVRAEQDLAYAAGAAQRASQQGSTLMMSTIKPSKDSVISKAATTIMETHFSDKRQAMLPILNTMCVTLRTPLHWR